MSDTIKDKIVSVKDNGYYGELPKTKVKFAKSGEWTFFSKEFPGEVGDILEFTVSNAKHKTAKHPNVVNGKKPVTASSNSAPWSTSEQIVRNVAYKGVVELIAAGVLNYDTIERDVNEHHKILISKF